MAKLDFMNELAKDVEAKKRGETTSFSTISDYHLKNDFANDELEDMPEAGVEETTPVSKEIVHEPVKKQDDSHIESFRQEERVKIEKPRKKLKPLGMVLIGVLSALIIAAIYFIFFAPKIVMPNFVGEDLSAVSNWAKQYKIESTSIAKQEVFSMGYNEGLIMEQSVEAGKRIKPSTPITITVSKGPDPDELIDFPDLYGMTMGEINDWKSENKLLKTKVTTAYSTTVPSGGVISFDLKNVDQENFMRGSTLNIVCSKGAAPAGQVTVENFVGKTIAEAESWGITKKLVVNKVETYSATVAQGLIISQSTKAGEALAEGESITFYVSKGKGVLIPQLVGYTAEQLEAWMANSDNNVTVVKKSVYNEAPAGSVISQGLPANSIVDSGTVLELTISLYLPIFQTTSNEWVGKDYLQIKYWVDEVNSKGGYLQAGEYLGDREYSDSIPKGGVIRYACEFGTEASNDMYNNGCERPLTLGGRIGYVVSLGPATPEPVPKPQPDDILFTSNDIVSLSSIMNFCNQNGLACTYEPTTEVTKVEVRVNGGEVETGSFTKVIKSDAKLSVKYNPEVAPE